MSRFASTVGACVGTDKDSSVDPVIALSLPHPYVHHRRGTKATKHCVLMRSLTRLHFSEDKNSHFSSSYQRLFSSKKCNRVNDRIRMHHSVSSGARAVPPVGTNKDVSYSSLNSSLPRPYVCDRFGSRLVE